jgi:hypothetical protein
MGDKKEMKEFNISNRFLYTIIALIVIITLGVNVYASGGTHTMGELAPPCNGILTSSGGSWSCIASPATCTGTNQILHFDGSSWSCATISAPPLDCNWNGWSAGCVCLEASRGYTCGIVNIGGIDIAFLSLPKLQEYCSGGIVTDSRELYCCDFIGGDCQPY